MSDPLLDALAESARNRGLKLVRSRVRTPGKRRFGKVGLTDPAGKAVLGMDARGPTAKPEEVEAYLRSLDAKDWGASLGVAEPKRKKGGTSSKASAPPERKRPAPKTPPKAKPIPKIREAKPSDAARLVDLIKLLEHDISADAVRRNLAALRKSGDAPLVATLDKQVVGLCGLHRMVTPHRESPVGRITILVVEQQARGEGIGRMLVAAAEERLRKVGCKLVEITSNDRLAEAHAFYHHMDFERTSIRFCKSL
ncbi:N-acetylglutamate synthase-like GNAT family acetyltransferase [Sphingomonas sp. F9_3S_D5_B_2]